jgi:hypothetical protein
MQARSIREGLLLSKSKGVERLVLAGLLDRADQKSFLAWPSVNWLMGYSNASERAVQMGLSKLMAKGEVELIELGGGRRKSNTYLMSVFNQPSEVSETNPAGNAGLHASTNPADFSRNPAVSSPNPAEFAPKRKERKERGLDPLLDGGSTAIGADTIDELMIGLVGIAWKSWASNIAAISYEDGIACVVVEGEYAAKYISQKFGDALLIAFKRTNVELEVVRVISKSAHKERQ